MKIKTIKTRLFHPPKDDLFKIIKSSIKKIPNNSILVIASKIVAIHQGRCIPISKIKNKDKLIAKEADRYLPRKKSSVMLTIKHNILIPSAGIDESNAKNYYILWPKNPNKIAKEIYDFLKKQYKVKNIAVIIADSHTIPLRRGVIGIALSYYGLRPINDYRGKKDLFNRELKMTTVDVVDGLAAAGVFVMGEGAEQTPLALITNIPSVKFTSKPYKPKKHSSLKIHWNEDLYGPILKAVKWKKQ